MAGRYPKAKGQKALHPQAGHTPAAQSSQSGRTVQADDSLSGRAHDPHSGTDRPDSAGSKAGSSLLRLLELMREKGPGFDPALHAGLTERVIPLRWTGVSSRVFSAWKKEGLIDLPDPPDEKAREWVRLTLAEFLYIRLLLTLRLFGMPLSSLLVAREHMLAAMSGQDFRDVAELLSGLNGTKGLKEKPETEQFLDNFFPTKEQGGAIAHLMLLVVVLDMKVRIHVYETGDCATEFNGIIEESPETARRARIVVTFNELVYELALRLQLDGQGDRFAILTENERHILDEVRSGRASSITIEFDSGQPKMLRFTESKQATPQELLELVRSLKSSSYREVVLKTNGGRTVHYEDTRKQKLPAHGNVR